MESRRRKYSHKDWTKEMGQITLMGNSVIIASRPSAVINLEDEKKITFLRLKPFDTNNRIEYFKENYERAKQLSEKAPDLIAIPVLAYMLRTLIEDKRDKNINNRTMLYEEFIEYILIKYKHGRVKLSPGERTPIRMSLGKIAYEALAEKEPHIQVIPLDFCYDNNRLPDSLIERKEEILTRSGLVNLIIERSGWKSKDFLFFTHQSFQEYLAAEYMSQKDDKIKEVLSEKWNPKWKEVLKFLVGMNKGQVIIDRILDEKDNAIHSKLFLAAELITETTAIDNIVRNRISQEIENIFVTKRTLKHLMHDAEIHLMYTDKTKVTSRLVDRLQDSDVNVRVEAIDGIKGVLQARINNKNVRELISKLVKIADDKEDDYRIRSYAIETLGRSQAGIDNMMIGELISSLVRIAGDKEDDYHVRSSAIEYLGKCQTRIDDEIISILIDSLMQIIEDQEEDYNIRFRAIYCLEDLKDRINDNIVGELFNRFVNMAVNEAEGDFSSHPISALGFLKARIDDKIIGKLVKKCVEIERNKSETPFARGSSIEILYTLETRINDEIVREFIRRLVNYLNDKSEKDSVRHCSFWALSSLEARIDDKIVRKFICSLVRLAKNKEEEWGRCHALYSLERFSARIDDDILGELITCLIKFTEDEEEISRIRSSAIKILMKLQARIDDKIIGELFNSFMNIARNGNEDRKVRFEAIDALCIIEPRIDNKLVAGLIDEIARITQNENEETMVRCKTANTLWKSKDIIDFNVIRMLIRDLVILIKVNGYYDGRMEALMDFVSIIDRQMTIELVEKIIEIPKKYLPDRSFYLLLKKLYQEGRLEYLVQE